MATWWIVLGSAVFVAQNRRSPGSSWSWLGWGPTNHCSRDVRGRAIPAAAYAHWVRPEQSNVVGPVAPHTYGMPSRLRAAVIAVTTGAGVPGGSVTGGAPVVVMVSAAAAARACSSA